MNGLPSDSSRDELDAPRRALPPPSTRPDRARLRRREGASAIAVARGARGARDSSRPPRCESGHDDQRRARASRCRALPVAEQLDASISSAHWQSSRSMTAGASAVPSASRSARARQACGSRRGPPGPAIASARARKSGSSSESAAQRRARASPSRRRERRRRSPRAAATPRALRRTPANIWNGRAAVVDHALPAQHPRARCRARCAHSSSRRDFPPPDSASSSVSTPRRPARVRAPHRAPRAARCVR